MFFDLPPCTTSFLLITDNDLSSPADFLLHRTLHQHLKSTNNNNSKAIILSVSEDLARWKAIASASRSPGGGLDLDQCIQDGSVEFITVLAHVTPQPIFNAPFKPLFDLLSRSLPSTGSSEGGLVILDDISTLEWIGYEVTDVLRFVRALRAACIKAKATLVLRYHRVSSDLELAEDDMFATLYQLCTYHIEVRGLASGRSGSVSGEIALHPGPATAPLSSIEAGVRLRGRSSAIQYKLTDAGPVFFEKGSKGL